MKNASNIFIIGSWGVGKSTIGYQLAQILKMDFYDTDRILEARTGVDVSWIFDVEGEEGFRKRETELLRELVKLNNVVLSTGGCTVLLPENRQLLADHGVVVYLYTSLSQQVYRTHYNKYKRPLLRCDNVKERLEEFDEERRALYEEIADLSFSTNGRSVQSVVNKIAKEIKAMKGS